MTTALRRRWDSLSFRLAFYCGLLMVIVLLTTLGVVHLRTVGVMQQALERQVRSASQQLAARHADGGRDAVVTEVQRLLHDGVQSDAEVYLVLDAAGQPVAGNVAPTSVAAALEGSDSGSGRLTVQHPERAVPAWVQWQTFADGTRVVVGQDLRELESLEDVLWSASAASAMVALLLLVGGTFVFRMELERSIGALRRTAARIAAGELQERIDLHGEDDELALLKQDINHMLDRIHQLMEGVRGVSDSVAHNLRTPLTRVSLRLRRAQDPALAPPAQAAEIAAAERDLQELAATFEKLLQIAEAESGTRRRRFGVLALERIADDVVDLYEPLAEAAGMRLVREPADPAAVDGDRDLLADATANLLANAVKYAGPGATVRIGTCTGPAGVLLSVQDDGPGVPAGELARLGQRFHRLDRSRNGYGLGLASVRAIALLHGGDLRFSDARPGLRVELALPLPAAPARAGAAEHCRTAM